MTSFFPRLWTCRSFCQRRPSRLSAEVKRRRINIKLQGMPQTDLLVMQSLKIEHLKKFIVNNSRLAHLLDLLVTNGKSHQAQVIPKTGRLLALLRSWLSCRQRQIHTLTTRLFNSWFKVEALQPSTPLPSLTEVTNLWKTSRTICHLLRNVCLQAASICPRQKISFQAV